MPSRPQVLAGLMLGALALALVGAFRGFHRSDPTRDVVGSWDAKDAWRRCRQTDPRWPEDPAEKCRALHMCVNEAAPGDNDGFMALIAATPDCPPP